MTPRFYESRITAKGQTTIPVEVREHLRIAPGDTIQFVLVDGRYEIIPRNRPASDLFGCLQDYAIENTTLEDYRNAVSDYFAGKDGEDDGKGEAA